MINVSDVCFLYIQQIPINFIIGNFIHFNQIDCRDREIGRLNMLLIGGRPVSALGKDCCYRGIGGRNDDIDQLQKQKLALQEQLKQTVVDMHDAKKHALQLADKNGQLEQELRDLERIALQIESEANRKLADTERFQTKIEVRILS